MCIFHGAPCVGDAAFLKEFITFVPRISFQAPNTQLGFYCCYYFLKLKRALFLLYITVHYFKTIIIWVLALRYASQMRVCILPPPPTPAPGTAVWRLLGYTEERKKAVIVQKEWCASYIFSQSVPKIMSLFNLSSQESVTFLPFVGLFSWPA